MWTEETPAVTRTFDIDAMLDPAAYPHPAPRPRLQETHVSWVVLTGPFAYKIKKPVHFDFLDASTLEKRRALCAQELRLNRRLAPGLYLDAVPITREAGRLRVGGSGAPVEFAVRMHQFNPAQELAHLLERDAATAADMDELAGLLAGLHQQAAAAGADSAHGRPARVRAQILANLAQLRALLAGAPLESFAALAGRMREAVQRLEPLIALRHDAGHVRECHGDLHAGNLVRWQHRWMAFDCLEFDPALRWIDVIADAAFLFMDVCAHGREDLAWEFLSRYLEHTGDYAGLRLLRLHAADRALVRAKVEALRAAAAHPAHGTGTTSPAIEARVRLAARLLSPGNPALLLMHGVTASGKSWLAGQLVPAQRAVRIRSDLERKRLAGIPALSRRVAAPGEGDYGEESTRRTYERLLQCADAAIDGGCNAIIDATFLDAVHRAGFGALAARRGCPFLIVSCAADAATLRERLLARSAGGADPSEATLAVLDHQLHALRPLAPQELRHAVQIDTAAADSAAVAIAAIRQRLRDIRGIVT